MFLFLQTHIQQATDIPLDISISRVTLSQMKNRISKGKKQTKQVADCITYHIVHEIKFNGRFLTKLGILVNIEHFLYILYVIHCVIN